MERKLKCKLLHTYCIYQTEQNMDICRNCSQLIIVNNTKEKENEVFENLEDLIVTSPIKNICDNSVKLPELDPTVPLSDLLSKLNPKPVLQQEQAMRFNEGKPQWSLVHYKSLEPMVRVLEYGCIKYAPFNWQKPMPLNKILESIQRHVAALMDGEEVDAESGISHMGHIQCNALFFNYHKERERLEKLKHE